MFVPFGKAKHYATYFVKSLKHYTCDFSSFASGYFSPVINAYSSLSITPMSTYHLICSFYSNPKHKSFNVFKSWINHLHHLNVPSVFVLLVFSSVNCCVNIAFCCVNCIVNMFTCVICICILATMHEVPRHSNPMQFVVLVCSNHLLFEIIIVFNFSVRIQTF